MYGGRKLGPADPVSFFGYLFGAITVVLVLTVLPFGFAALVADWWRNPTPLGVYLQPWVGGVGIGLVCLIFIVITLSASQRISAERQRRTLDSLLLIPRERSAILFAKWQASILSTRRFGWCLALVWLLGSMAGAINPFALPLLLAACMAYTALAASLGLWLSCMNKTNLRAMLSALLAGLVVFSGPGILFPLLTGTPLGDTSPYEKVRWGPGWLTTA